MIRFKKAAVALTAFAAAFSVSPLFADPQFSLVPGRATAGTVAMVRARVSPRPLILRFEGLGQQGRFYAESGKPGYYMALLAVPLKTKEGTAPIVLEWGEPGSLKSGKIVLAIEEGDYPSSPQPLKVKKLRSKLYSSLPKEKHHLKEAWDSAGGPPQWGASWIRPLEKEWRISSVFGKKRVYNNGVAAWSHKGVDYAAPEGTPVLAPNDGVVLFAREGLKAYGGVVVVGHGYDLASSFLHLSKVTAREGDRINKGQVLGEVGSEGIATGAHLHWQMTLRGHPVQPLQWLSPVKPVPGP